MRVNFRFVLVFLGLVFGLAHPAFAESLLKAYNFVEPSTHAEVKLSPSGNLVAFFQRKTAKACLDKYGRIVPEEKAKCREKNRVFRTSHIVSVFDLNENEITKIVPLPENYFVSWIDWASDERFLMGIYSPTTVGQKGRGYSMGGSRVLSVSMGDESIVGLFTNEKSVAKRNRYLTNITNMLRSDPDHVIMPANRRGELDLWKVNLIDGKAERIALGTGDTFYWFTDHDGKPIMRFDCGSRCREVKVYTPDEEEKGEWKRIKRFKVKPDADEEDFDFWPIASAPEEGQYYVLSDDETDERRSVKIFDLEAETFVETVYEHPKYDVGGPLLTLETGEYAGVWYVDDRLKYDLKDKQLQRHVDALNTYFDNQQNVRVLGFNKAGDKAVIYAFGPGEPGGYYYYDFKQRHVQLMLSRMPTLKGLLTSKTDIVQIKTRDGEELTAYHTYPKDTPVGAPLIVMPHGGPEARDRYDYDRDVEYFANRGYQILRVNFRGSSGYGRTFAEAGYGEWGGVMQNDVTDAVRQFHDAGIASPDTTCIVGYSYGGYVALYGGASTPKLYKCVVSGGGLSDLLLDIKRTRADYGKESEGYEYWLLSQGDPKKDKDKLRAKSPVNLAAGFTAPVLLVHGAYDEVVYPEQSRKMKKALEKVGKKVTYVKLEDAGHSGWDVETSVLYLETVESFLREHIGP